MRLYFFFCYNKTTVGFFLYWIKDNYIHIFYTTTLIIYICVCERTKKNYWFFCHSHSLNMEIARARRLTEDLIANCEKLHYVKIIATIWCVKFISFFPLIDHHQLQVFFDQCIVEVLNYLLNKINFFFDLINNIYVYIYII